MIKTEQHLTFELEDGRFIELTQTEEKLVVIIPARMKWFGMKQIGLNLAVILLPGMLFFIGPGLLFLRIAMDENHPLGFCLLVLPCFLSLFTVFVWFMIGAFSKTTLRFTKLHLVVARRFLFIPIWRRIPLHRVGKASCEMTDDLYWDWPEDTVRIPYGKNNAIDIIYIKSWEDQKNLAAIINTFISTP